MTDAAKSCRDSTIGYFVLLGIGFLCVSLLVWKDRCLESRLDELERRSAAESKPEVDLSGKLVPGSYADYEPKVRLTDYRDVGPFEIGVEKPGGAIIANMTGRKYRSFAGDLYKFDADPCPDRERFVHGPHAYVRSKFGREYFVRFDLPKAE